jgi:hypothetical protein
MSEAFPYRAKPTAIFLAGGFFTLCATFCFYKTATNGRGLVLNGILEFSPAGATAFYCSLGVASALFVLCALVAVIHGVVKRPVLILADDQITVPSGFLTRREKCIVLSSVTGASVQKISNQLFLTVWSADEEVSIARRMLPSQDAFDRIVAVVTEKKERPNQAALTTPGLRPSVSDL